MRAFAAGTTLPLQSLALRGAALAPPQGRTAGGATLRTAAQIGLRSAIRLLAASTLRALVIRTSLPLFTAVVLPRAPARLITSTPGLRAPLRTLLQEAITHPLAHHFAQVAPAAPLSGIAAELLHGRAHPAILTTTPSLRAAGRALLEEALTHPLAHPVTQIATAAPFLRSTAELLRALRHRAAAEILPRRAHTSAFAPAPVLPCARRAHGSLVVLRPLTRPLPLIQARTTPGRPHRAAFVVAIPGTLRRRTEGRAHQQGGGE